jgi:hypothetical protein
MAHNMILLEVPKVELPKVPKIHIARSEAADEDMEANEFAKLPKAPSK